MARLTILLLLAAALYSPSVPYDSIPVVLRGHQDAAERRGHLLPVVVGQRQIGLCLSVAPTVDSHGWVGSLRAGRRLLGRALEASQRRTGTVCFETSVGEGQLEDGEHSLCLEVQDRIDGRRLRPPCRRFRFRGEWQSPWTTWRRVRAVLEEAEDPLPALDELEREARALGLRFMPLQIELVAVHQLVQRGDPASLEEALARLGELPRWLPDEAAAHWAGQAALQRARLLEQLGRRGEAWRALSEADAAMRPVASSHWLGVTMHQAGLLADQGAVGRAVERLRFALRECELSSCRDDLVGHARAQLAWRLLQQDDVTAEDLQQAESMLEAVTVEAGRDPLETANHLVNLAWVRLRRGLHPVAGGAAPPHGEAVADALGRAREILAPEADSARARSLAGWADLVEATARLEAGDLAAASARCAALAESRVSSEDAELAAWANACAARAARLRGDLGEAARLFDLAILRHEYLRLGEERARPPMGTGERAALFFRAARVAAEGGDAAAAWAVLDRLDALAPGLSARRRCRADAEGADLERWRHLDAEAARLFARLRELEGPVAGAARALREAQRHDAKERLREIYETLPGCPRQAVTGSAADLRLFLIDRELWALERGGRARRLDVDGFNVRGTIRDLRRMRSERAVDDGRWRQQAEPLADLLRPFIDGSATGGPAAAGASGAPTLRVALHGLLQDVPFLALPDAGGGYWGHRAVIARVPSAAELDASGAEPPSGFRGASGRGVIVLDPLGDLAGTRRLLPYYRRLAPESRFLIGGEASADAFLAAAAAADWLHVDGHGRYDTAFPELSGLVMADGLLDMPRLATLERAPGLVNLSGCRTGAWPRTADSGHYGLGGLLVRAGTAWVIASADDLDSRLAGDFNRSFYRSLLVDRADVPEAFRLALADVATKHPAASWSNLQLLASPAASPRRGGNSSLRPLPRRREGETAASAGLTGANAAREESGRKERTSP